MDELLTEAEQQELDGFIAHLEALPYDDFEIVETRVYFYPASD